MVTGSGVYRCRGLGVRARVGDSVSGPAEALVCGYESTVCLSALHVGVMFITGVFYHLNRGPLFWSHSLLQLSDPWYNSVVSLQGLGPRVYAII